MNTPELEHRLRVELADLVGWLGRRAETLKDLPATVHSRRRLDKLRVEMRARAAVLGALLEQQQTTEGGAA